MDETAAKAVLDAQSTDFYKNELDSTTQAKPIEKTKYIAIQQKLDRMKAGIIKQWGTKDSKVWIYNNTGRTVAAPLFGVIETVSFKRFLIL
jgi:hypothetical protein